MKTRKLLIAISLVMLLVAGSLILLGFEPREPRLLQRARRVADTRGWWIDPHLWLSDHHLLVARWGGTEGFYRYDIITHTEDSLDALYRRVRRAGFPTDRLQVSPDGQWVLWDDFGSEPVYGARLNGSDAFTYVPRRYPGSASFTQVRWSADSRHWIAFVSDRLGHTEAMIYDVNALGKPKSLPVRASDGSDPLEAMGLISTQSLVNGDRLRACSWGGNQRVTPSVDILEIGIGKPPAALKTHQITLPTDSTIQEMVISPSGEYAAWLLTRKAVPSWYPALHRILPFVHIRAPMVECLWVGRSDGTGMHQVGYREMERTDEGTAQVNGLTWLPDNRRLSFILYGQLYTVSAF